MFNLEAWKQKLTYWQRDVSQALASRPFAQRVVRAAVHKTEAFYASNTSDAAALIGRRIGPEVKYGANTIGSGPWLEVGKSRDPFTRL